MWCAGPTSWLPGQPRPDRTHRREFKRIVLTFLRLVVSALIGNRPVAAQAPVCSQSVTTRCLYLPATEYTIGTEPPEVIREIAYKDMAGMLRTVKMAIRVPKAGRRDRCRW